MRSRPHTVQRQPSRSRYRAQVFVNFLATARGRQWSQTRVFTLYRVFSRLRNTLKWECLVAEMRPRREGAECAEDEVVAGVGWGKLAVNMNGCCNLPNAHHPSAAPHSRYVTTQLIQQKRLVDIGREG